MLAQIVLPSSLSGGLASAIINRNITPKNIMKKAKASFMVAAFSNIGPALSIAQENCQISAGGRF
jgi:hypothetical protein